MARKQSHWVAHQERPKMHVRKGDQVYVISGEHKGKGPLEVLRVIPERAMVVVKGVNLRWKHLRKSQQNPKGGRIQKECPIAACKVLHYSAKEKTGVRIHREVRDGKRVRVGTCGTVFN